MSVGALFEVVRLVWMADDMSPENTKLNDRRASVNRSDFGEDRSHLAWQSKGHDSASNILVIALDEDSHN